MRSVIEGVLALAVSALSVAVLFMGLFAWTQWGINSRQNSELIELRKNAKDFADFAALVKERCECENDRGSGRDHGSSGSVRISPTGAAQ